MQLFEVLTKSQHNSYRDIITGDQSWFLYNYSPKGQWVLEDEEAPTFPKSSIITDKMMLTVIWGVFGTYILDELPEGEHLNSKYFIEHIIKQLEAQEKKIWPKRGKHKIWLHLDNCRVHNSQDTQKEIANSIFKRTPHPPYSPDLAPSDFYLFGYVKEKLKGRSFKSRDEIFDAVVTIIDDISMETKRAVFDDWARRCQWVASHEGEYYHK